MNLPTALGTHALIDLIEVHASLLIDAALIEQALRDAAAAAGATALFAKFHQFGIEQGITGVVLLQESHITIHTWPEYRFAAADIFLCGACQMEQALQVLRQAFAPCKLEVRQYERGMQLVAHPKTRFISR